MEARTEEKPFAPNPEVKLHFLDYWRIVRIRKTVILLVFLLIAITTTVVTFFLPESYSSMVRISIESYKVDVEGLKNEQVSMGWDPFRMQTEFQRIQSRPVLERVVERLNLQEQWAKKLNSPTPLSKEQAYRMLKGSVDVRQSHNSTLVEVTAFSSDKDEAPRIANEVAEVYRNVRDEAREKLVQHGIEKLREQLKIQETSISATQGLVNRLRADLGISDYDAAGTQPTPTLEQETLRKIDNQRMEAERTYLEASNVYTKLASLSREEQKNSAPLVVGRANSLNELIGQENSASVKWETLKGQGFGPEHADVKAITQTLGQVTKLIDAELKGLTNGLRIQMETAQSTANEYQRQMATARQRDLTNYATTRPYYEAKEELTKMKQIHDRLAVNVQSEMIALNTPKAGAVEIIEPAVKNDKPVRPNKPLNIALGVIVGLIIGVGLAFFIEYLDTSVKTIDDVERALQAPVLGVIPQNVGLLIHEGPESPHGEAYRVLRTNVLFSRKDPKLNTVTVVSGGAGEGKSTTIFNLATVFAQNGQRVLVVDSDLRRPSLHKFLKLSNSIGLTDFLMKRQPLEAVIQTTNMPTLDFLPSGKLPSSSLGILSSVQMKELIRDVKRRYDFVFFDSPPIMGVSDASILASEVDMVLQVIQYRRYPQPMTIRAKQMIEKVGGNLLGIVLNNINMSQDENYYYYSGYYYDYYTKGEYAGEYTSRKDKSANANGEQQPAAAKPEIKSKF
ncbi:MAG TPA: polysaccharide biosynthesis tyrosine autokinase [Longimicrobiales bacterium]|nr:polysaccharide biosynthesis tyrosine autokinase [Longimicrobiales bacterium]